jgi:hypothetical protein
MPYTRVEQEALFRYAHAHDVEQGGRYDARSGAINLWSHPWSEPRMREESTIMGTWDLLLAALRALGRASRPRLER